MFKQKLILGSANFSSGYGIKKSKGLNIDKINSIYDILKKNKINFVDSAFSYPGAEKKIGKSSLNKLKIYTKIPKINYKRDSNPRAWIKNIVEKSLERTNQKSFSGIYFHNANDLLNYKGKFFYDALNILKNRGIVKKIGVSVYSPMELENVMKKFPIDIVQIPLNVFDRRFLNNNYLQKIKRKGIEIHARSIFLQGILLKNWSTVPKYFNRWSKLFKKWDEWNEKNNQKKINTCLNFVKSIKYLDKIVFGISNLDQLKEIIKFNNMNRIKLPKKIFSNDKNLLDPRLWQKN